MDARLIGVEISTNFLRFFSPPQIEKRREKNPPLFRGGFSLRIFCAEISGGAQ